MKLANPHPPRPIDPVAAPAPAPERLSVLVIEDNAADADLVREMLRQANLVAAGAVTPELHHVETLRGALDAARRPFDVALLDLALPDASGLDGLAALSAAAPQLPAVVLTGTRDPALAARALVAGAQDFLVKGEVEGELLLRALRFAVARQRRMARPTLAAGEAARPGLPPLDDRPEGSPRRVLVVEDNPADADLVRLALSGDPAAFAVHHVERLRDALAFLSSREADAVLLDLGLPDAMGVACIEKLRAAFPELPVVVLTGNASNGSEAVRLGVQDYVVKGELEPRALQRSLEYAIVRNAHHRRARELAAERAAHAATQAAARALQDANAQLAIATRQAREALEREAGARAEAERRRHEIEALFGSMTDAVLFYGEDGRIQWTNRAAIAFFGSDVRGLARAAFIDAADLRFGDGRRITAEALPASRALGGAPMVAETLRVRTPGGERIVAVSASPIWRGDAVRGAVCVYRDVTDLVRAEQALRKSDERKNEFLAMLSHELRNPLAPILNSVHILARATPGGEQADRARSVIDRQVRHLTRLVDDLLDVTRISRGKVRLQRERVDLSALVRHVADDHRSVFANAGIELEEVAGVRPVYVSGDATRISQVVGNLLHNAAKFTPRGGRATLSVEATADGLAVIRVRDTGAGITPAALAHVFEPFVQADGTLDRTHGGLGLGLALVKGLVELHGGGVAAHSAGAGMGAEFTITFPLDRTGDPRRDDGRVAPAATGSPRRVLVIEDNVDAAETLREVLELNDHVVAVANSGPEGLALARAFRPEIVLCDIGLPAMDGFEVASAMRADPALRSTALVALSGYAAPADLETAALAGFDRHVAKPVDTDVLERIMSEVAAGRA